MKYLIVLLGAMALLACNEKRESALTAAEVVNRAIEVAGGDRYRTSRIDFEFRGRRYVSYLEDGKRVLQRLTPTDSALIEDTRIDGFFRRRIGDSTLVLPDSTSRNYSNSVNSVHYFAYLPYGLNGEAVQKELLGVVSIGEKEYYKIRVTFRQEGGGEDFQDIFVYWFNTQTFRPDFLAYEYQTEGGGLRFREAYNDREVGGIWFADYRNLKPAGKVPVTSLDSLFVSGELEELSIVELKDIQVTPGSYN